MADSDGRHRRQVVDILPRLKAGALLKIVKCEEPRFRGDAACSAWRKATVDEIIEHFKNR